jgi:hypothetical protein
MNVHFEVMRVMKTWKGAFEVFFWVGVIGIWTANEIMEYMRRDVWGGEAFKMFQMFREAGIFESCISALFHWGSQEGAGRRFLHCIIPPFPRRMGMSVVYGTRWVRNVSGWEGL